MQQVHQGMCDDLNTPLALAALSAPLKAMNDLLSTKKGKKAKGRLHTLAQYQLALQETFRLLGMQVTDPQKQLDQMRQLALSRCACSVCTVTVTCLHVFSSCTVWYSDYIVQQAQVHLWQTPWAVQYDTGAPTPRHPYWQLGGPAFTLCIVCCKHSVCSTYECVTCQSYILVLCRANMTEEDVAAAIDRRAEARQAKDYSKADAVRAELSKKGIAIMDTAEGVEWRPTTPEP